MTSADIRSRDWPSRTSLNSSGGNDRPRADDTFVTLANPVAIRERVLQSCDGTQIRLDASAKGPPSATTGPPAMSGVDLADHLVRAHQTSLAREPRLRALHRPPSGCLVSLDPPRPV